MSRFRNSLAASVRALPSFRGKGPLGVAVGRLMTNYQDAEDCVVTIKMQDSTLMRVDVRSKTEQWAYWTGDYDQAVISRLASCLQKNWVVFDVGANVGFYSIALGNRLRSLQGRLHAFEPVRSNFNRLSESIRLNSLEKVINAHNVALGNEEGMIEMFMDVRNNASTGNAVLLKDKVLEESGLKANLMARITPLDSLVQAQKIEACHLIKIDVEGAEVMFLRGGESFLSKTRPIIYGEFNPHWLQQFGHSFLDVAGIVKPWDYRLFKQESRAHFCEFKQPKIGIADVLLCPSETPDAILAGLGVVL